MKRPVFSFEAELLTDAPFDHIVGRHPERIALFLQEPEGPGCLGRSGGEGRSSGPALEPHRGGGRGIRALILAPHEKGAHLRLEGCMKGWAGILFFGLLRWRTDRLLDRFVEEL